VYRRIHLWLDCGDILDAARFIAGALLLSHSVRRDSVAAVRVGGRWVIVYGDRVRHLRPDEESLEGWIRAVMRGKGGKLGAVVSDKPPEAIGEVICVGSGELELLDLAWKLRATSYTIVYGGPWGCTLSVRKPRNLREYMVAPLVNVILDNIEVAYGQSGPPDSSI